MSIDKEIKQFILKNFLFTEDLSVLSDTESLMQRGIIDSTGVLELVNHLQDAYKIQIFDDEMIPENLDSIVNIAAFLGRKRATVAA